MQETNAAMFLRMAGVLDALANAGTAWVICMLPRSHMRVMWERDAFNVASRISSSGDPPAG